MTPQLVKKKSNIDWIALSAALALCALGLLTMNSFEGLDPLFVRQTIWILLGVIVFFAASAVDWRFLRRGEVVAGIYGVLIVPLFF